MSFYITHIVSERLPKKGLKQISFLTSNKEDYKKGFFFYGYNGSTVMTENQLSEEIAEGKVIRLAEPLIEDKEMYLWIDSDGKIWKSEDIIGDKKFVEYSGLRKSKEIFTKNIQFRLMGVHKRISI